MRKAPETRNRIHVDQGIVIVFFHVGLAEEITAEALVFNRFRMHERHVEKGSRWRHIGSVIAALYRHVRQFNRPLI